MPTASKSKGSQFDVLFTRDKAKASAGGASAESTAGGQRKLAKSKDPLYTMTSVYLKKKLMADCVHRLSTSDDPRDFSELVGDLLEAWHGNQGN